MCEKIAIARYCHSGRVSAGDEPEGSASLFHRISNPFMPSRYGVFKEADGLMLGICNGFQALIKLGLLPYGEIRDLDEESLH